ncbi:MAG: HNH endonuclease [Acidimicrobiales bacterium]
MELCRPEIDHVIPVSGLGAHVPGNMQIVCRACNAAKGSSLIVDPAVEMRYAGRRLVDVPRMHLFRLLQWLIQRRDGQCDGCATVSGELTMRPVHRHAPLARAALLLCCYGCRSLSSPVRRFVCEFSERPPLCRPAC